MRRDKEKEAALTLGPASVAVMLTAALSGAWYLSHTRAINHDAPTGATLQPNAERASGQRLRLAEAYGKLPLRFEPTNSSSPVSFLARGSRYTVSVMPTKTAVAFTQTSTQPKTLHPGDRNRQPSGRPSAIGLELIDGNPNAPIVAVDELPGVTNYLIGSDASNWRTNVRGYARVEARGVYPGIDVAYYGNGGELEQDFVVAPGAGPDAITLEVKSARQVSVTEIGEVLIATADGDVYLRKPTIYQAIDGVRREIAGSYELRGTNRVGFQVAQYDTHAPLIIDPVLSYATYLGGSGDDGAYAVAVDASDNVYVTGFTLSSNLTGVGATSVQQTYGGGTYSGDAFVAKLNPSGTALVYCTYLGGDHDDLGQGIAVDSSGNAYVVGYTRGNFPGISSSSIQPVYDSFSDGFLAKLNAAGTALVYSTYLGGSDDNNAALGVAVDASGNAYVTGYTISDHFPGISASSIQSTQSHGDAFLVKVNAAGTAIVYSTYLGGDGVNDQGNAVTVDSAGNAYVVGYTDSATFTGVNASSIQSTFGGGYLNAFVTKVNSAGTATVYSTFLGGSGAGGDGPDDVTVDAAGNAYVAGFTTSADFPGASASPIQSTLKGSEDAFVVKINASGSALLYSTFLGGSSYEFASGITVDSSGNAYVTGLTGSSDFPGTNSGSIQSAFGGGFGDGYVAELNAAGTALLYSTYLGGSGSDTAMGLALSPAGNLYVAGFTSSNNFPGASASPIQPSSAGGFDAFVVKLGTPTSTTITGSLTISAGQTYTFNGGGVTGTITMSGGTLVLMNALVGGNLLVTGGSLTIVNSTVQGSVQISGNATFFIDPSVIAGNVEIHDIPQGQLADSLCAVTINGNLSVHDNGAAISLGAPSACAGNTIGNNLSVTNNTAAIQVFGNKVNKNLSCTQNGSISGGGNTAAKKVGQCAAF